MQKIFLGLLLALSTTASAAKPFRRVLVLTGGMLEFYTRLGIWSELNDAGWTPDLVITTCGSSMLGAIIQAHADPREAREYMLSEDFYNGLSNATRIDRGSGLQTLSHVYFRDDRKHMPNIYTPSIIDVDVPSPRELFAQPFKPEHPHVLMIEARVPGPEAQGTLWSKLPQYPIQEVYATDPDTAARLPAFRTPSADWSERIAPMAEVETNWDLWTAARASYSEPYILPPTAFGNAHYATGAVNLVPVELALELGDDVLITYGGQMSGSQAHSVENLFGFNQNERGLWERNQTSERLRWIDLSDDDTVNSKYGISPDLPFLRSLVPLPGLFLHLKSRMPDTYQEFITRVRHQYVYGAERAREALSRPHDQDYSYIRWPWKKK